jgi:hypothetical protein
MTPEHRQPSRRRRGKRLLLAPLVAVAIAIGLLLPPAAKTTAAPSWRSTTVSVRGAYHIHSNRSDGAGTLDDIAEAASRAGLQFVIVTDHGDGTRPPEAPSYRHGVLCLDAVELNTNDGHYVALGLGATPYPLAGTAESVVEDVARLGGFGFAAHADSSRVSLQWRAWDVPFDGLEWLNADSEWRDEPLSSLGRTLLTYWARPSATLTSLLDRPQGLIVKWNQLTRARRVPVLAGSDAHARLGFHADTDPDTSSWYLPMPGYRASFEVFSNHVVLDRGFSGSPADDAERLLRAIRQGRVFTVVDGLATPGAFDFTGMSGEQAATLGDDLALRPQASLHARVAAPTGASLALIRNGELVKQTTESEIAIEVSAAGAYRIEVTVPGNSLPWIFSNPIYVGFDRPSQPSTQPLPVATQTLAALAEASGEASNGSTNDVSGNADVRWQYRLAGGIPAGQYAAVRFAANGPTDFTRVRFDVSADRPTRLWVQLRRPGGVGERWGRTFFVDQADRTIDLRLDTFAPIGVTSTAQPMLAQVDSLLFVVDTLNTLPGSSGRVHLRNVAFVR